MIDIQTFTKFCHLLSYKYNVRHLDDSGIKICITKIISVLLQQLYQEAQINSFQLNGHKNDFKITASDKEKKTYLTLLTLFFKFCNQFILYFTKLLTALSNQNIGQKHSPYLVVQSALPLGLGNTDKKNYV